MNEGWICPKCPTPQERAERLYKMVSPSTVGPRTSAVKALRWAKALYPLLEAQEWHDTIRAAIKKLEG